jgi:hypothetical protein
MIIKYLNYDKPPINGGTMINHHQASIDSIIFSNLILASEKASLRGEDEYSEQIIDWSLEPEKYKKEIKIRANIESPEQFYFRIADNLLSKIK